MVLMLFDTGVRRAELASMLLDDVKLSPGERSVTVLGKGGKRRPVYFGSNTAIALDRYMAKRDQTEHFDSLYLWVGHLGPLTGNGVYQIVKRRGVQAGVPEVFVHQLRHSFANYFLLEGGQESDLSTLLGWETPAPVMLKRYAVSASRVRAKNAHRAFGPGDKL